MGYFDGPDPEQVHNWVCILERGTEYEVAMAKNYLSHLNIPSNILSKRDSSYNLNIGETSMVYLYVPGEYEKEARQALQELEESEPLSDDMEELEEDIEEFENEGGTPDETEEGGREEPDSDEPDADKKKQSPGGEKAGGRS